MCLVVPRMWANVGPSHPARQVDGPLAAASARGENPNMAIDVCAHITGTVWKIQVEKGAQVQEDDVVVIIESMKMEMPVTAPDAGTVTEIRVSEGESVEEGDVLLVLDA